MSRTLDHVTVVYSIQDQKAFDVEMTRIKNMFMVEKEGAPYCVTAMSADHEMERVYLIEEALERYSDGYELADAIRALVGCLNIKKWSWEKYEKEAA